MNSNTDVYPSSEHLISKLNLHFDHCLGPRCENRDTMLHSADRIAGLEAKVQEIEAENSLLKQRREEAWSISNGMPSYAQLTEKFGELKVKLLELEAENMKLRYACFRSADYATRSISNLPTPPEE